jgi:glutamate/tyrosine decarboxylase-like PLP-dependent enzyme
MFGYVQSSASFAGVVGDFLTAALNQNVTSWRSAPSATTVELRVIDWIKSWIGCPDAAEGVLLSGGSAANHAALDVALRASTPVDLNALGVAALPGRPRIYATDRVHMSIPKSAAMLGIGREAICLVPTDDRGRMDAAALEAHLARDAHGGVHRVCVVGSAGEVNTGAIDPLDAMADICARHGVWFHVDGSYGAFAAAGSKAGSALAGLGRADSIAVDPHKWLFMPLDAGCLLVKDGRHLRGAFSHGAAYIDVVADRDMSDFAFWEVSPELSRRFRALKIWFALKCHGSDAIVAAIDRNIALAEDLASLVERSDDFELLAPPSLSIVCFRYRRRDSGDAEVDDFNRRLMLEVQRQGDAYLSNATLNGRFALRACIVNFRTSGGDIERLLDTTRRAAARLVVRS